MASKNLPTNFNVSFDVEDDIQDKIIYHLGSAFNYIRDLKKARDLEETNTSTQLSHQLRKIASIMDEVLPGIIDETIEYEANETGVNVNFG